MGIISTVLGFFGFGFGTFLGLLIGYFLFIYTQSSDVQVSHHFLFNCYLHFVWMFVGSYTFVESCQDPEIQPLVEQDTQILEEILSEIPLWIKNPDYDRVCVYSLIQYLSIMFSCDWYIYRFIIFVFL